MGSYFFHYSSPVCVLVFLSQLVQANNERLEHLATRLLEVRTHPTAMAELTHWCSYVKTVPFRSLM